MEHLSKLSLMELSQLWCGLVAPDFDLYKPSDNYF